MRATERLRVLALCLALSGCVAVPPPRCRGEAVRIVSDAGWTYVCTGGRNEH